MSKLKNKIKTDLHEVTARELGKELDDAKGEVKNALPSIGDDEVEDIVTDVITNNDDNQNDSSSYTQSVSEMGKPVNRVILQQKPNPSLDEMGGEEMGGDLELDSRQVQHGINPEGGEINYEELNALIADINAGSEPTNIPQGPEGENELPFEGVNPRMSKNELMENVLNHKKPKVIKKVKVKDIKNGK